MRRKPVLLLSLVCTLPGSLGAQSTPMVTPGGIVNSASFAPPSAPNGSLAPGSLATIFGSDLAGSSAQATNTPLPTTLADVDSVTIGGVTAPLVFVSSNPIDVQIPFEVTPGDASVVVTRGGKGSAPQTVTIVPASPGIFTMNPSGQGAIVNLRGTLVDSGAPAAPGDFVVVFCTGLGATTPAVPTGAAAPLGTSSRTNLVVSATVDGQPANVGFAGLAPGYAGLYQVNVQIPSGVTSGNAVTLSLTENGISSNPVTLAIQASAPSTRLEFSPLVKVRTNFSGEPTLQIAQDGTLVTTDLSPPQIHKSTDRGATWSLIPPPLSVGGSDMDGALDGSGRMHVLDLARNVRCVYYYRSEDGGNSFTVQATPGGGVWLPGDGGCDALPTMVTVDRPWVGTFGADTVYLVFREPGMQLTDVNISHDGGQTYSFTPVSETILGEVYGMAVDPVDGSLYLLGNTLGNFNRVSGHQPVSSLQVARSADGANFSVKTAVPSTGADLGGTLINPIAVDAGHNVYIAWASNSSGTWEVYMSVSRDRGQTWSAPIRVSQGLTASTFPTLTAGDAGHVAVAWYGTPDPAKAPNDAHGANWYVYVAMSTNATDAQPVFEMAKASEQPFHHNSLCNQYSVCEGTPFGSGNPDPPGYEEGIQDFFRIAVDPTGAINVIWHDTTTNPKEDHFARQTGGHLLKEKSKP